jgi:hypothetical protein
MPDDFHPVEYKDMLLEPILRLPFFDKVAGCMSSSIDAAAVLIEQPLPVGKESAEDS